MALAAVMYLLLPGVFAVHAAVAHTAEHHVLEFDSSSSHHDADGDHPADDSDSLNCDLCHMLTTLGHAGDAPSPLMSTAIDVASYEHAFTPVTFCLPADDGAEPASPRAPPHL